MREYAVDNVKVSFFGLDLSPGLAEGTSIQEGPVPQAFRIKPNGMGGIVYTAHPDRSGTMSVQIVSSSKVHSQLLALYNADLLLKSVVGVLLITDKTNGEVAVYSKSRILGRPSLQKGTQLTIYSWIFGFERSLVQSFDPNRNVVGA